MHTQGLSAMLKAAAAELAKKTQTNWRIFCFWVPTVKIGPNCNSEPKLLLNSCARGCRKNHSAAMCLVCNKVSCHKQIALHQFCNQKKNNNLAMGAWPIVWVPELATPADTAQKFFVTEMLKCMGTGIRGLLRGMATLPKVTRSN